MGPLKTQVSSLRVVARCRGEGVGYLLLGTRQPLSGQLSVQAHAVQGSRIPCAVYPVQTTDAANGLAHMLAPAYIAGWVVVLPLLSLDCVVSCVEAGAELLSVRFSARLSKVESRLLTQTNPALAACLRGYERTHAQGGSRVEIVEVWPHEAQTVAWRVRAVFPVASKELPVCVRVYDAQAHEVAAAVTPMEDQVVPDSAHPSLSERIVTVSCVMPQDVRAFFVETYLEGNEGTTCFDGMNAPRATAWLDAQRARVGGAPGNARYAAWFETRRATAADLARQRAAVSAPDASARPLLSLVMPVYKTEPAYLRSALESVCAQSYERWELVAVQAGDAHDAAVKVLAEFSDPRIRVIEVPNRSIAENTNAGIEQASGDYVGFLDHDDVLESDCLWCYAVAIAEHPQADLLYCDEDRLDARGVHCPAFKTFPNYGKLYCHNYVTHLLMVSRRVLERTERSGPEVSGAQDYDLTLKAFEVARDIVHIPRVLYHWREHEGSTAGGTDQKPFAHAAGARALAAHLVRRGIAASVEDGALPYTYHVRYDLPDPAPKVSIVIPTRDQAALLQTCVASILARSGYPNFEVLLVENNSTEPETFALYEKLQHSDSRVRVAVWRPEEVDGTAVPDGFNYSALVNFGVRHTDGEFVVLLNNDTEVIAGRWLEEMAGCLMRPEVGVVGAKLLFGDGLIQHVGMVANPDGNFCHVCQNLAAEALGPGYAAAMPGDYAMVTGACQMMRRTLFDQLGGYDEQLAVGYNDGDFCLRARAAGYTATVCADAVLHHREFSTRGREATDSRLRERFLRERAFFTARHAAFLAAGDPALNLQLDPYSAYFDLRF